MSKKNPVEFETLEDSTFSNIESAMPDHQRKDDTYKMITDRIISLLEQGTIPWRKSWDFENGGLPHNFFSDTPYRGINLLLLSCSGYNSSAWLTKKQIEGRHGKIKEGELPTPIIFYTPARNGGKNYFFLKTYGVYNLEQTEGIKPLKKRKVKEAVQNDPIEKAESIINNLCLGPKIIIANNEAPRYRVGTDTILVPEISQFSSSEEYYSTLFHEIIHSTGAKTRKKRATLIEGYTKESYSKEELIAEFGSAFLCAHCEINNEKVIENQAAYIQGWVKFLKEEPGVLIQAASAAQKAVSWVLKNSKAPEVPEKTEEENSEGKIAA